MGIVPLMRAAVIAVLVAMTLEVSARVDDYLTEGAPLLKRYDNSILLTADSDGPKGNANARFGKWHMNSLGYRGPEPQNGRTRIVTLGASETFGMYESADHEYPRLLEEKLNRATACCEVINAALAGQSLIALTARVPEIARNVHPKYALIYPSPAAYIDPPPRGRKPMLPPPATPVASRILDKSRNLFKEAVPDWMLTEFRRFSIARAVRTTPLADKLEERNIVWFREDLTELIAALQAHGIEPILLTHATRFGQSIAPEEQKMMLAWRRFYPRLKEEGFLDMENRANDAVRQIGAERQLLVVDVAKQMPVGPKYFADFVHFTNDGSERMASILAEGIRKRVSGR